MSRIVFRGANLFDGEKPVRPNTTLVVEGDRITRISGDSEAETGADDRVIELAGRTLMPGLISCHFHSSYDDITIQPEPLGVEKPPGYLTLVAAKNLRTALHFWETLGSEAEAR